MSFTVRGKVYDKHKRAFTELRDLLDRSYGKEINIDRNIYEFLMGSTQVLKSKQEEKSKHGFNLTTPYHIVDKQAKFKRRIGEYDHSVSGKYMDLFNLLSKTHGMAIFGLDSLCLTPVSNFLQTKKETG